MPLLPGLRVLAGFRPAVLSILVATAAAQQEGAAPLEETFGHSRHGSAFDEGPRQAAYLMDGLNPGVRFAVTTRVPQAQQFFEQGICQQHGFWYFEAERSFRQVAMLDPDCAMAYWGMCVANRDHHKRAAGFITQAVQRSAQVTERERLWIDAWADFYQLDDETRRRLQSDDPTEVEAAREEFLGKRGEKPERDQLKKLARELVRGIEVVVHAFPEDVEAKAFLAVQCWYNLEYGVSISSHSAVDALLDQVFAAVPDHPAHHFRVHLWDREKAERALRSAARIGQTAPAIAHQWHMGGHIYAKLDRHDDAAWMQEASARIDHAHMMRDGVMPYEIHNYGHNNEWLCRSLMHTGRVREAIDLARNMVELPRHPEDNRVDRGGHIAGYGRTRLLGVLREFELWDELASSCSGPWLPDNGTALHRAERFEALGIGSFRSGNEAAGGRAVAGLEQLIADQLRVRAEAVDAAEAEALAAGKSGKDLHEAMSKALESSSKDLARIRERLDRLRLEELVANGETEAAVAALDKLRGVPALEKAWLQGRLGSGEQALEQLAKEVERHPGRVLPAALFCEALWAAGRQEEARQKFEALQKLAAAADANLPVLLRLQPIADAMGLIGDWRTPVQAKDDVGKRPLLSSLGPFRWGPVAAPSFELKDASGRDFVGPRTTGRPTLLVFYLGFGCLHCVEQLNEFAPKAAEFAALGIDIIAIGTEDVAAVRARVAETSTDDRLPFTLLCDPDLRAFKAYRAFDDFENMPLHSTVLIDVEGRLRWQDISFEPFRKVDWLLAECERLLAVAASSGSK